MKKILIIFLLLFCINVKADEVNIDKINSNYEDYLYIEVTSNDNLDKLSNFVNAKEILFKNVNITDTSILNNMDPYDIKDYQYDFVCNGYEMASGGVRNHSPEILKKAFAIAGYSEEVVKKKFPSLYEAFKYGAPPHAGMAPGIDRILMLLKDEENIREMVAFPLGANGADAMMGCPNEVFEKQLRETHIKIRD